MDDFLEKPSASAEKVNTEGAEDVEQSSDEDDDGPDWTKLTNLTPSNSSKLIIPKRGDKEFEPAGGKGTNLQQYKLDCVREAMFSTLDVERTVSSKVASYAVWCPEISRARVLSARGNFLVSMGHSVFREAHACTRISKDTQERKKAEKVIELLPEEALYLIERGSLLCWSRINDETINEGVPISVQQAYAEMTGKEELTLERYQVYAYLKRLGYTVTRARPPDPYYNTPAPFRSQDKQNNHPGVLSRLAAVLLSSFRKLFCLTPGRAYWWHPLGFGFVHRFSSYSSIFSTLRFIPSGYSQPLHGSHTQTRSSPYEIFFHLYKPTTSYRKTTPPPPDSSVIVVDGRTTPMPTLHELCSLFEHLPELPPPTPRKRFTGQLAKKDLEPKYRLAPAVDASSLYIRLLNFLRWLFRFGGGANGSETRSISAPRRPNPFQILKSGKKMIMVAAVDSGVISFFRFCQGSFDEWPMV